MPTSIEFVLSPAEHEQLCDLARERGCTVSDLAREAVQTMYLEPRRLRAQVEALGDQLAALGVRAEDVPPLPNLPTSLARLLAGVERGGMFAGLEEIVDNLDDLRERLETNHQTTPEDETP